MLYSEVVLVSRKGRPDCYFRATSVAPVVKSRVIAHLKKNGEFDPSLTSVTVLRPEMLVTIDLDSVAVKSKPRKRRRKPDMVDKQTLGWIGVIKRKR